MPLTTPSLNTHHCFSLSPLLSLFLFSASANLFSSFSLYSVIAFCSSLSPPLFQSEVMSLSTYDDLSSRWMLGGVLLLRLAVWERKKEHKRKREWVEDENCTRTQFGCTLALAHMSPSHMGLVSISISFIITIIITIVINNKCNDILKCNWFTSFL